MTFGISAGTWLLGGAAVGSAYLASKGQQQAANTQANAARETGALQSDVADRQLALQKRQYEEGVQRQQPFLTAGTNALARMQAGEFTQPAAFNPNDPAYARPAAFNPNDPAYARPAAFNVNDPRYAQPGAFSFGVNDFQADPGYAFRLSEGQRGLERSAAARGGLISGTALKAASRFSGDLASQEYGNAFSRALTQYGTNVDRSNTAFSRGLTGYNADVSRADTGFNRALTGYNADVGRADAGFNRALTGYNADVARSDTGYNRLAAMAGMGGTTSQQLNTLGSNYATGASNTLGNYGTAAGNAITAAGNANAAGTMGMANTFASGINTAATAYQNQKNFNDYLASRNRVV